MNRKFISMFLVGAIALSSTACSFMGPKITVDKKDAEDFANDYCEALLSANKKSLKKMVSEDDADYIDDLTFTEVTDDDSINEIYERWFETASFEVGKVKFDEETGNAKVDVTFSYVDAGSFELDMPDFVAAWINSIDQAEQADCFTDVSATLDLIYDAEEEAYVVKSPEKFNDNIFDMFDTDFDGVVPDDATVDFTVEWVGASEDTVLTTDSVSLLVTFDDEYGYFTDRTFDLTFSSEDGSYAEASVMGYALSSAYEVDPDIFGLDEFVPGDLSVSVSVTTATDYFYDSATVEIVAPEVPASTTPEGLLEHDPDMCGTFDRTTNQYINEHAGVTITFGAEYSESTYVENNMRESVEDMGMTPDVFISDNTNSEVWIISTVTLDPTYGPYTAENMADQTHPAEYSEGGVGYFYNTESEDTYLFESFLIPIGDGMIIVYHYSIDFNYDNGAIIGTLAPIA